MRVCEYEFASTGSIITNVFVLEGVDDDDIIYRGRRRHHLSQPVASGDSRDRDACRRDGGDVTMRRDSPCEGSGLALLHVDASRQYACEAMT